MTLNGPSIVAVTVALCGCVAGEPKLLEPASPVSLAEVPIVYGYGRKHLTVFEINESDHARFESMFDPPAATPWEERQRIRAAIALMEQIAGEQTPTHVDLGGPLVYAPYGSMDCVDESTNTTTYLRLFDEQGWLRHHVVLRVVTRAPWFDVHNTAQIMERESGARFVVDSWYGDNGEPPFIQDVHDWMKKKDWPVEENPELADA